jgi:hypothetical protein
MGSGSWSVALPFRSLPDAEVFAAIDVPSTKDQTTSPDNQVRLSSAFTLSRCFVS